jgi:hypothetical protein
MPSREAHAVDGLGQIEITMLDVDSELSNNNKDRASVACLNLALPPKASNFAHGVHWGTGESVATTFTGLKSESPRLHSCRPCRQSLCVFEMNFERWVLFVLSDELPIGNGSFISHYVRHRS